MSKNQASDLITDQEMAFARLVLSGTMNDRDAAQAAGLNPNTAAYTKSKPSVCAYMLGHRAAVQQQLADQEVERLRRLNLCRERVLTRLWDIANTGAEMTRGVMTTQMKALSMIAAIEGLIPDRRAASRKSTQDPVAFLSKQGEKSIDPEPSPALAKEEDQAGLAHPEPAPVSNPGSAPDAPPFPDIPFDPFSARTTLSPPYDSLLVYPEVGIPFTVKMNPTDRRR